MGRGKKAVLLVFVGLWLVLLGAILGYVYASARGGGVIVVNETDRVIEATYIQDSSNTWHTTVVRSERIDPGERATFRFDTRDRLLVHELTRSESVSDDADGSGEAYMLREPPLLTMELTSLIRFVVIDEGVDGGACVNINEWDGEP
ncbi:MAG: hypothetical protein R3B57_04045 [Phycisphaerales bacterium]